MLKTMRKSATATDESGRILAALRAGVDPGELARELASQRSDDCGSARRLVDVASVRLWLAEAIPLPDIITMLETRRRFDLSGGDCHAYAVSILWEIWEEIPWHEKVSVKPRKETRNAVA